ncbi:recombination protein O N-terminal domain-containing protein [Patescibacteria group bacterium]|nr:recombination protein O N-terminal domain-containing protein [Patescibacteria group bacterium]
MSSGHKYVLRGVVVRRAASGDGSARVLLYTDAAGLVWAHVQSGREERSQLRAHLQVGTRGLFSLVKGKDVWRVTGISGTENLHFTLSGRTEAQKTLQRVLLFVRQFVRGEGSDPYFFTVLWGFLDSLSLWNEEELKNAETAVVFRMLAALGYVEGGESVSHFLHASYAPDTLAGFSKQRKEVLGIINEGITASGLT